MHEMSIVEALLDAVHQEVRAGALERVTTISIRLGRLRQVVPEMLLFAFEAATRETPLVDARLEVEQIPARAQCASCGEEFTVEEQWFECPGCGAPGAKLLQGNELLLTGIQLTTVDKLSVTPA